MFTSTLAVLLGVTLAPAAGLDGDVATLVIRSTAHRDPAIHRALAVVGQALSPIVLVDREEARRIYARHPGVGTPPDGLNAFRAADGRQDPRIYVVSSSEVYRRAARRPSAIAVLKLAATLVHEQVHATDGDAAAYRLQADFVRSRLSTLPPLQRAEGHRYLQGLDARARALAPGRIAALRRFFERTDPGRAGPAAAWLAARRLVSPH